jgi:hemerythrin-like domain-containing protein
MRITDRLKAEHGVFLKELKALERLVAQGAPKEQLAAVVAVIAEAEEHHSALEERVLYPALVKIVGPEEPRLAQVSREHVRLRALSTTIAGGSFAPADVSEYARAAREHFEHEIHGVFVLAEELIDDAELARMANWNVDHTYEELGKKAPWRE